MKTYTLITGASKGIGREFAKLAADAGQNLILVARDGEILEALRQELSANALIDVQVIALDLSKENSVKNLVTETKLRGLSVDTLINNAGYGLYGKFLDLDGADETRMLFLNMISLTQLTRAYASEMVKNGIKGKILNVASTAAFQPGPLMATYYASKAYVLSLSEALNNEFKEQGISVTTLCPGPTETEFQKRAKAEGILIFKKGLAMNATTVARRGYLAMNEGKRLIIPGLFNCVTAFAPRMVPRALTLKMSRAVIEK